MSVLHVCKFKAALASRLIMQRGWDAGRVMDLEGKEEPFSYGSLWRVIREGQYSVVVFHMQSSLPYFIFCWFARWWSGRPLRLVYDIHDMNELPVPALSYMGFRFLCFYFMEWFVLRVADAAITVSKGLSRLYFSRYRCRVDVVRNIPPLECFGLERSRENVLVYFGLINKVRLPAHVFEALVLSGKCLHIYGRVDDPDPEFPLYLEAQQRAGYIRLCGGYSPDDLSFLQGYSRSLMIFEEGQLNLRYCLPNKLYQSAAQGVVCLVSEGLREVALTYSRFEGFVEVAPGNATDLAEVFAHPCPEPDWSSLMGALADEQKVARKKYLAALGMVEH